MAWAELQGPLQRFARCPGLAGKGKAPAQHHPGVGGERIDLRRSASRGDGFWEPPHRVQDGRLHTQSGVVRGVERKRPLQIGEAADPIPFVLGADSASSRQRVDRVRGEQDRFLRGRVGRIELRSQLRGWQRVRQVDGCVREPRPRWRVLRVEGDSLLERVDGLVQVLVVTATGERRGAAGDAQAGHLCEGVEDLFGEAVGEVALVVRGAQVGEGKDGDRGRTRVGARLVRRGEESTASGQCNPCMRGSMIWMTAKAPTA